MRKQGIRISDDKEIKRHSEERCSGREITRMKRAVSTLFTALWRSVYFLRLRNKTKQLKPIRVIAVGLGIVETV